MHELTLWHAAILGLVEGITEYLPVSSTGHLIITSALLGLNTTEDARRNMNAFEIVIQGGAILAVLGLYWPRVVQMIRGFVGRDAVGLRMAINIIIAFLPAAVIGLALHDVIEQKLFYPVPVMGALALGGLVMIFIGRWQKGRFVPAEAGSPGITNPTFIDIEQLTWKHALIIGAFQCLALWPGTSRSMVTIVGGMVLGLKPKQAAEFSFLLGLPTLGGACLYSAMKNFRGDEPNMIETFGMAPIIVGILVATISAAIAVKWLVVFLSHHGLAVFGWYRLILCAVLAIFVWRGTLTIAPEEKALPTATAAIPVAGLN